MATTALSYQMMFEEKFLFAMINAEQKGNYYIASAYAKVHANFLGLDSDDLPKIPLDIKTTAQFMEKWQEYYFKMLSKIGTKARGILVDVREKYRDKSKKDLPQ